MVRKSGRGPSELLEGLGSLLRRCLFRILSMGAIPNHIAFIMDGNRRYAKKENLEEGAGHKAGFSALMTILNYCYELGVRCVTVYAFSIDNFKRKPDEVQSLMDLMQEKIEDLLDEESVVNQYGIRVYFIGNLKLLSVPVRVAAEKVMRATANNTKCALMVCIAYTSYDEIVHAIEESCKAKRGKEHKSFNFSNVSNGLIGEVADSKKLEGIAAYGAQESCKDDIANESRITGLGKTCNGVIKEVEGTNHSNGLVVHAISSLDGWNEAQEFESNGDSNDVISVVEAERNQQKHSRIKMLDIEEHMYMAVAPDPDILLRSSGETRLSNFLLWQTSNCPFYSPNALWPDIGLWHLVWAVLIFQRNYSYLEKKRKQL